jgi:hypothetical protein
MVISNNAEFQRLAAIELGKRRLGPFRSDEAPAEEAPSISAEAALEALDTAHRETAAAAASGRGPFAPLSRRWKQLPGALRTGLVVCLLLLGVTAGVQWETPGGWPFAARLLLNAWILALVLAVGPLRRWLAVRIHHEFASWVIAFLLLAGAGYATDLLLL